MNNNVDPFGGITGFVVDGIRELEAERKADGVKRVRVGSAEYPAVFKDGKVYIYVTEETAQWAFKYMNFSTLDPWTGDYEVL